MSERLRGNPLPGGGSTTDQRHDPRDGTSRRDPIAYHVHHALGTDTFQIDQTSIANVWIQLGTDTFHFDEGYGGSVVMTNEDIDVSRSMYAGAVQFEFLPVVDVVD